MPTIPTCSGIGVPLLFGDVINLDRQPGLQRLDRGVNYPRGCQSLCPVPIDLRRLDAAGYLPHKSDYPIAEGILEVAEAAEHGVGVNALLRISRWVQRRLAPHIL